MVLRYENTYAMALDPFLDVVQVLLAVLQVLTDGLNVAVQEARLGCLAWLK